MYELTETSKVVEGANVTVYGIKYDDEHSVPDISTSKAEVEGILETIIKNDCDPCHLKDVVEDFLN